MALERFGQNLGTLDTQPDSVVLNGRNGGLRDSSKTSKLALAQFLKLAKNTHRLTY
jgi:hypothetical protein